MNRLIRLAAVVVPVLGLGALWDTRIARGEAERTLSPMQMSFMRESRRIGNRRLKNELKLRLAYPTVDDGIRAALERKHQC